MVEEAHGGGDCITAYMLLGTVRELSMDGEECYSQIIGMAREDTDMETLEAETRRSRPPSR